MKNQIKNMFLSLLLGFNVITYAETQAQIPKDMPMPSVSDIFGGMSEEEITKQVQEAQKLFESLSPEEMSEFEKVIEHTLKTMTPQDIEDIQGIAKMVEPHLDLPKEEPAKAKEPESKPEESKEKIKDVESKVSTDSVQTLIDNIKKLSDEIKQKIDSNKELSEEFKNKWTSKITFENMIREILTLKQDRLAKKLTKKDNQEDKDLIEKIEYFYKELKKLNDVFIVEDSFGITISKKENDKLLKKTKEILALFEDYIDEMMPLLEKFLRKYDPEALQISKEYEERKKRAKDHAVDSRVKRESPSAISTPEGAQPYPAGSQAQPGQRQYPYYDNQYGTPYGYDPATGQPFNGFGPQASPTESGRQEPKAKDGKSAENERVGKDSVSYDDISDQFEDFFSQHDKKSETDSLDFLQKDIAGYPTATDNTVINKAQDQTDWINSTGNFSTDGFKTYSDKVSKEMSRITSELKNAQQIIDNVENDVPKMPEKDLKKLENSTHIGTLQTRLNKYNDEAQKALIIANQQYQANIDPNGSPAGTITSVNILSSYQTSHQALMDKLESSIIEPARIASKQIDALKKKIKRRVQRKSKAAQSIKA